MAGIDSDLIRGHIDTIILKSLFEGDKYGLEIIQEIEEKSNGSYELKQPTLYSCLKRLENQGLISSYWEDSEIGGKRHYYTLTDLGKEEYQNNQKEWSRSKEIIDNLIYDESSNPSEKDANIPIIDQLDNDAEEMVAPKVSNSQEENISADNDMQLDAQNENDFIDNSNASNDNFIDVQHTDDTNVHNLIVEETNLDEFASFDEIENTAFDNFFDSNSEISSKEEFDDDFDEPTLDISSENNNLIVGADDNIISDSNFISEDTETEQEYVSLLDVLAQSSSGNNQYENDQYAVDENLIEEDNSLQEISQEDDITDEYNDDVQNQDDALNIVDAETDETDDENPIYCLNADQENICDSDAPLYIDNSVEQDIEAEDNEPIYLDDDTQNNFVDDIAEADELSNDDITQEDIYVDNNSDYSLSEDTTLNDDEIYTPDLDGDDEIYNPISEDDQIYIPQSEEESLSDIVDQDLQTNNLLSENADDLLSANEETTVDNEQDIEKIVPPTYINFASNNYDQVDITNQQEMPALDTPIDESLLDENEVATEDLETTPAETTPIYRASQEEIESLYKTTENYQNLQAGYTDETYKQMLNELESYGSSSQEEPQQTQTAKTFEELSAEFEKEGIEIRKYEKQQKESNDTKIYIKTHQIHLVKNWITFGITTFALLLTFLIMNAFKENYTYSFNFWPFAIALGVSAIIPLYSTLLYIANPYKKVVAKYAPRLNILLSILINVQLIMIIYCVNLQLGFYSFTQENYNHLMWILPLILSFIPTIQSLIYYPLYYSKNYHI